MIVYVIVYDLEGFMLFKIGLVILVEIFKMKKRIFCEYEMYMKCVIVMCYLILF